LSFAALLGLPFLGAIYLIGPFLHVWVYERLGPEAPTVGRLLVEQAEMILSTYKRRGFAFAASVDRETGGADWSTLLLQKLRD